CCSIEAHRRRHVGELDPHRVIGFILLEADYPRSVRYCAAAALEAIAGIRAETRPPGTDAAERILGRLEARLAYAVIPEVIAGGLSSFLGSVQDDLASAALAVQKAYFLQ
ncbi:MAG TPA: alpha-E domain-containing protein, partial [Tepidisphaeraceae bacterium]